MAVRVPLSGGLGVRVVVNKRLWYLVAGTRGGINRAKIIWILRERPSNANVIAESLHLDYKTVRHHLDVLRGNGIVMATGGGNGYATEYALSPRLQTHFEEFLEIWTHVGKK